MAHNGAQTERVFIVETMAAENRVEKSSYPVALVCCVRLCQMNDELMVAWFVCSVFVYVCTSFLPSYSFLFIKFELFFLFAVPVAYEYIVYSLLVCRQFIYVFHFFSLHYLAIQICVVFYSFGLHIVNTPGGLATKEVFFYRFNSIVCCSK